MLYTVIAEHLETFLASLDNDPDATGLPAYVQREFYDYLPLQRHLTYGLPYMLLCEVVIAHFSRPPRGPIRAWESPPLTCRPLGHQSAALVPAWSWTRPGSAADGGLLR